MIKKRETKYPACVPDLTSILERSMKMEFLQQNSEESCNICTRYCTDKVLPPI